MARILIADDDVVQQRFVMRELEPLGHEFLLACSPEEAIETLRHNRVDLVLLDMCLQVEGDGAEALAAMKKSPQWREIPVLIMSGVERPVADFIAQGAEDYLVKSADPAARQLLRARVKNALQRQADRAVREESLRTLRREREKIEWLLNALFPYDVAQELLNALNEAGDVPDIQIEPRSYNQAAVLFADVVGFTKYCESHHPREVVGSLKQLVTQFEQIIAIRRLEKIKTIGDSFMATAGLKVFHPNPVKAAVDCAMEMMRFAAMVPPHWTLRVGIDIGPVVGGIVGSEKFQYDIWGRTVNMAARVESVGVDGCINLSQAAWNLVSDLYEAEVTMVSLKGIGESPIYTIRPQLGVS